MDRGPGGLQSVGSQKSGTRLRKNTAMDLIHIDRQRDRQPGLSVCGFLFPEQDSTGKFCPSPVAFNQRLTWVPREKLLVILGFQYDHLHSVVV